MMAMVSQTLKESCWLLNIGSLLDTSLEYASNWTKSWLEPRLKQNAFTENTLFVLTWDENKTWVVKKNQVLTVLLGPAVKRSSLTDGVKYDHYSILRTVEDNVSLDLH